MWNVRPWQYYKKICFLYLSLLEGTETETNLTYDVKVHTAEESLPKRGPLNKAMKIHEIHISSDGEVRSKFLPSDVFYESVKIKESRRHRRVEADIESDLDE